MFKFLDPYINLISLLALMAAVFSICLTLHLNRRRIDVDSISWDTEDDPQYPELSFVIHNIGSTSITLQSIEFYSGKTRVYSKDDYVPEPETIHTPLGNVFKSDNIYGYPQILDGKLILQPYSDEHFSYRFEKVEDLVIKVTCKERIRLISRSQSFSSS